jgi:hypothetical protein
VSKLKSAPAPAPRQIEIASMEQIALWVVQINDHQRAIGDLATRLLNEVDKRQAYINSLPKPEAEKAGA